MNEISTILICCNQLNATSLRHLIFISEALLSMTGREQISTWVDYAEVDIEEDKFIIEQALLFKSYGIKKLDSLHIACAIKGKAEYFLTTDDGVLKKAMLIQDIKITDPIGFIKEVAL